MSQHQQPPLQSVVFDASNADHLQFISHPNTTASTGNGYAAPTSHGHSAAFHGGSSGAVSGFNASPGMAGGGAYVSSPMGGYGGGGGGGGQRKLVGSPFGTAGYSDEPPLCEGILLLLLTFILYG